MLTFRDHLTGPESTCLQIFYSAWTTESMPWVNKCLVFVLPPAFSALKLSVTNTLMSPLHVHHACLSLKQHRCELPSKVLALPWKDRLWVQAHMMQKSWREKSYRIEKGRGQESKGRRIIYWRVLRMRTGKDLITILMPLSGWLTQLVSQGHTWWQWTLEHSVPSSLSQHRSGPWALLF